jgi:hypothetical protein
MLCRDLLAAGAEADLRAHDNATPLLLAASEAQFSCVQLLLSLGVCEDAVFSPAFTSSKHTKRIAEALNGFTARDFAIERGDKKLEDLLVQAGGAAPCKEPKSLCNKVIRVGNPAGGASGRGMGLGQGQGRMGTVTKLNMPTVGGAMSFLGSVGLGSLSGSSSNAADQAKSKHEFQIQYEDEVKTTVKLLKAGNGGHAYCIMGRLRLDEDEARRFEAEQAAWKKPVEEVAAFSTPVSAGGAAGGAGGRRADFAADEVVLGDETFDDDFDAPVRDDGDEALDSDEEGDNGQQGGTTVKGAVKSTGKGTAMQNDTSDSHDGGINAQLLQVS